MGLFVGQKADVHVPFFLEGHGDDAGSVQFLVDDPAAHGIAVEPDQQVEQGGPVSDRMFLLRTRVLKISSEK